MNLVDLSLIVLIALTVFVGIKRGLLISLLSALRFIVSIPLSFFVGNNYNEIIYRTGDLGYYNNDGLMCFSSRKDFQIKHMGHRIELGEIDMAINAVDDVVRACCIFHQDANKILGFYEGAADKKTITHVLMQKLPKFMIPQEFIQVESMPITKNGKIDRKLLLENYIGGENA
jgi:D-alanine--poly(phosphoribitol) ligase subunit 1